MRESVIESYKRAKYACVLFDVYRCSSQAGKTKQNQKSQAVPLYSPDRFGDVAKQAAIPV